LNVTSKKRGNHCFRSRLWKKEGSGKRWEEEVRKFGGVPKEVVEKGKGEGIQASIGTKACEKKKGGKGKGGR